MVTKVLRDEFKFIGLRILLYEEDLLHAFENHPGEVSVAAIKSCIEDPDEVIASLQSSNGCLFYQKQVESDYFVVVVHIIGPGLGEMKTAYRSTYVKRGKILFTKRKS